MARYTVRLDQQEFGPMSTEDLREMLQSGSIQESTDVQEEGSSQWVKVSDVLGAAVPSAKVEVVNAEQPSPQRGHSSAARAFDDLKKKTMDAIPQFGRAVQKMKTAMNIHRGKRQVSPKSSGGTSFLEKNRKWLLIGAVGVAAGVAINLLSTWMNQDDFEFPAEVPPPTVVKPAVPPSAPPSAPPQNSAPSPTTATQTPPTTTPSETQKAVPVAAPTSSAVAPPSPAPQVAAVQEKTSAEMKTTPPDSKAVGGSAQQATATPPVQGTPAPSMRPGIESASPVSALPTTSSVSTQATAKPVIESDPLKEKFLTLLPYLEDRFRGHIRKRYQFVVQREVSAPRLMKKGGGRHVVEAQFRGTQAQGRRREGVFFLYWYVPDGWVLVDTNYSEQTASAAAERRRRWAQWGLESEWNVLFEATEREMRSSGPYLSQRQSRNIDFLPLSQVKSLVDRLKKGDKAVTSVLVDQLFNTKNPYRLDTLQALQNVDSMDVLLRIKDFAFDETTRGPVLTSAIHVIGTSPRSEAFGLLIELIGGDDPERAVEALKYTGRFKDLRLVPAVQKWIEKMEDPIGLTVLAQALGDLQDPLAGPPLEQLFWKHLERERSPEREELLKTALLGLSVVDAPSGSRVMKKALLKSSEKMQALFIGKWMEANDSTALEEVRALAKRQGFVDLKDYVAAKVAAIDYIGTYGGPDDVKLLDGVLSVTQGSYGTPIRDAAHRAQAKLKAKVP